MDEATTEARQDLFGGLSDTGLDLASSEANVGSLECVIMTPWRTDELARRCVTVCHP